MTPPPGGGRGSGSRRSREEFLEIVGVKPAGLTSEICNMAEFLTRDVQYSVPRYQRPYSWSPQLVGTLIQDLLNAWVRNGVYYYIGNLVLIAAPRKNEWRIADGQQRLATTTMIFAYMRDRLGQRGEFLQHMITDGDPDELARIRLRPSDEEFFYEYVQRPGNFHQICGLDRDEEEEDHSQGRMCAAADAIVAALGEMDDDQLESFAKFISRAALFNVTCALEAGGALLVFRTVNDNKLELSHADLLKFALLENATMPEWEKEQAAVAWENLETQLGRAAFGELLSITPRMYHGEYLRAPGDLAAFAQYLFQRSGVEAFLRDWLHPHGEALLAINNGLKDGAHKDEINRRIACLKQLEDQTWLPIAVAFMVKHRRDPEKLRRFFRAVDMIAFGTMLGAVQKDVRETRWKDALEAGGEEAKLYHPKTGPLSLHELKNGRSERDAFIERFGRAFRRNHRNDSEMRALLLIRINACLPGGEVLKRGPDDVTVEHILPTKGGITDWPAFTPEMRYDYAHIIGNWTLLQRKQNELCGAKSFAKKKAIYFSPDFPIYAVTRTLEEFKEWGPREIELRRQMLQDALFRDWGI